MIDIKQMTLKEKLGQLIIAGFNGLEYNEHARILIEDYKVANIILFARNVHDLPQLSTLNHKIYDEVMLNSKTIPFIAIDQEGGMVTRIMHGATFCPGNMTLGATNQENCEIIGNIMGEELSRLGINLNFAPSLDVNNNPHNPVIGVRSYSDDPKYVSECGKSYITGLQSKGVIATAKHFPGHGDVTVDSHLGLPVIEYDKKRLNEVELLPFKAVSNQVDAIMSAHIVFKAYDDKYPATLSSKVLTDLLKEELGYKGLIVSDCMQMKAIDETYSAQMGAVMGIKAGLDMFCVCHTLEKQIGALEKLEEAVNNGEISMQEIDEKVMKVLYYKTKVQKNMEEKFIYNPNNLEYFIHNEKNIQKAYEIVEKSLTLVKGKNVEFRGKTLIVSSKPKALTIAEDKIDDCDLLHAIFDANLAVDTMYYEVDQYNEKLVEKAQSYDTVVFCSFNAYTNKKQAEMINDIAKVVKNFYVISMRNPYDILEIDVCNYLTFYECTPNSIKACLKYLKGEIQAIGKLPIKID